MSALARQTPHPTALQEPTRRWPIAPAHAALVGVAIAYCAVVALRTSQSMALTFDEAVYASQVASDVPPAVFTAPRARGMPWLLAPVAMVTPSAFAIRVFLTLLSGVSLYLAFRPWLAVMGQAGGRSASSAHSAYSAHLAYLPALAAGCFATLWTTVLYGTMAYPNLWLAFALVAGVGSFCRVASEPRPSPGAVTGLALAFAAASLLRPTDALAAAAPLLIAPLVVRRWRRLVPVAAALVGLAVGWSAWLIEAYLRFGGPLERLKNGAETNKSGLVFMLPEHFGAVDGPALLCRPQSLCDEGALLAALWWAVLPIMVGVGLYAAHRARWLPYALVAATSAVTVAAPYLFLIGYAAPRFLQPAYALMAIPTASGILWLAGLGRNRVVASAAVSVLVAGHILVQQAVLGAAHGRVLRTGNMHSAHAAFLRDEQDVRPPCLVIGESAIQQGYLLRCRSVWLPNRAPQKSNRKLADALKRGDDVVVRMKASTPVPEFMATWRRVPLPMANSSDQLYAYLPTSGGKVGTAPPVE